MVNTQTWPANINPERPAGDLEQRNGLKAARKADHFDSKPIVIR